MLKKSCLKMLLGVFLIFIFSNAILLAGSKEVTLTKNQRKKLAITIYNDNLALVKDERLVKLPEGESVLVFKDVSAKIKPETAILISDSIYVVEQNFEYDLLTPKSLLKKYIGKEVKIVRENKATGEQKIETAKILSVNNGIVIKVNNHIETGIPSGRIIYPDVPKDLRERPTLTMLVRTNTNRMQKLELSYITEGLSWKADYIAELNKNDNNLNLTGWVTLNNNSGISYENVELQLVAGEVNKVSREFDLPRFRFLSKSMPVSSRDKMKEESFFEYHLYTLPRKTTIKRNQNKQVALLSATNIKCKKEYLLLGYRYFFMDNFINSRKKLKVKVFVLIKNSKKNNLGLPLPKGIIRVYKKDSKGRLQFVGESRIGHTPENEEIKLKLGNAFDITAYKTQIDYKKNKIDGHNVITNTYKIEIKNAKKNDIKVKIIEPIPGEWKIIKENYRHKKISSRNAEWIIPVKAKNNSVLTYTVRIKY